MLRRHTRPTQPSNDVSLILQGHDPHNAAGRTWINNLPSFGNSPARNFPKASSKPYFWKPFIIDLENRITVLCERLQMLGWLQQTFSD
jgi:hypothetical protein